MGLGLEMARMRSFKRILVPMVVLTVALGLIAFAGYEAAERSLERDRGDMRSGGTAHFLWAAENESITHTPTRDEAVAHAKRFGTISALHDTYRGHVASMRAANPKIRLLAYVMGTYAWKEQAPGTFPEPWYLKDASGSYVRGKGVWPDHYLMDPTEEGWITNRIEMCRRFLRASGYDGCMVDILGLASLDLKTVTGVPIDPRTGTQWDPAAWLRATSTLAARIKDAVDPALAVGNGLNSGPAYFSSVAPSAELLRDIDGGIAEAWLRGSFDDVDTFPSVVSWRQTVDLLVDATSQGKFVMAFTKVWVEADRATLRAWYRFAFASFLLGADDESSFSFSAGRFDDPMTPFGPPIELGAPVGHYRQIGNLFERKFEDGTVLVNPTQAPVTIDLDRSVVTLDKVVPEHQRLVLQPHSGEVLFDLG